MPHFEEQIWEPAAGAYGGRRSRQRHPYQAYVPDLLVDFHPALDARTQRAVERASQELERMGATGDAGASLDLLARQLLRAEAVGSSWIEALQISHKRIARAHALPHGKAARDSTAQAVLGNVHAMEASVQLGAEASPIAVSDIQQVHSLLLSKTRDRELGGVLRESPIWIGGTSIRNAEFVPPPWERVVPLMDDLAAFLNDDGLPAIVQAAVAHVQFETIHPFADGNGRTGRCLIHTVLRRRRAIDRFLPPVSLVLAADAQGYVAGLTAYREGDQLAWIRTFAEAVATACVETDTFEREVCGMVDAWRTVELSEPASRLLGHLPGQPVLDRAAVVEVLGLNDDAASTVISELEEAGVLVLIKQGAGSDHGQAWEAPAVFELLDGVERRLAEASGRPAPARRT